MSDLYFSEREGPIPPPDQEEIAKGFWTGFVAMVQARLGDGSLAESFPVTCFESPLPVCSNNEALGMAVIGEHPTVPWPLDSSKVPPTLSVLDLIEFFYRVVSRPTNHFYHEYARHYHLLAFDREGGRAEYREAIDRLFRRNRHPFELAEDGRIRRIAPPVLDSALRSAQFQTGDNELDRLLDLARDKFCSPDPSIRKEGLEKLWDAWERLKTLYPGDKRASTESLLAAAVSDAGFRIVVEKEGRELTGIGNSYMIRHSETDRIPISSNRQVDYLFHRLFSLIWLLLKETGRLT